MSRQILAIGDTGSQLVSKFNANFIETYYGTTFYNIESYGAVGDNNTVNTTAIQAAIDAANSAGGGVVYVPTGTFKTGTLTFYDGVNLMGNGRMSVIKSNAAEPLVNYFFTQITWYPRISDLLLEGNNVGTIGLNTKLIAFFQIERVVIQNFTTCGVKLLGSLLGSFMNCYVWNNIIGVYAEGINSPLSYTNMVQFLACSIGSNSKYGVQWKLGDSLYMNGCDFEANGTADDLTTGAIDYQNDDVASTLYVQGLSLDNCWLEANHGTVVNLKEGAGNNNHNISNTWFAWNLGPNNLNAIRIYGSTLKNKLVIRNSNITNYNSIVMVGNKSIVINEGTEVNTVVNPDGGTYTVIYDADGVKP